MTNSRCTGEQWRHWISHMATRSNQRSHCTRAIHTVTEIWYYTPWHETWLSNDVNCGQSVRCGCTIYSVIICNCIHTASAQYHLRPITYIFGIHQTPDTEFNQMCCIICLNGVRPNELFVISSLSSWLWFSTNYLLVTQRFTDKHINQKINKTGSASTQLFNWQHVSWRHNTNACRQWYAAARYWTDKNIYHVQRMYYVMRHVIPCALSCDISPPTSHSSRFSPTWWMTLVCLDKWPACTKAMSHIWHLNGLSPECLRLCLTRLTDSLNRLPHVGHRKGRSPEWLRMCFTNSVLVSEHFPHSVHLYFSRWIFIWRCRLARHGYLFSHSIHW